VVPATTGFQDEEIIEVDLPTDIGLEQDGIENERLLHQLNLLLRQQSTDTDPFGQTHANPNADPNADLPLANNDLDNFQPYLQAATSVGDRLVPTSDVLDNTYVCVIHTNGVHHLAMVAC